MFRVSRGVGKCGLNVTSFIAGPSTNALWGSGRAAAALEKDTAMNKTENKAEKNSGKEKPLCFSHVYPRI
jgi:hypothetical protein